jgi:hypothetical protein
MAGGQECLFGLMHSVPSWAGSQQGWLGQDLGVDVTKVIAGAEFEAVCGWKEH